MKYWIQTRVGARDWCDSIGTDDLEIAISHAKYLKESKEAREVRVIERQDVVISDI